MQTDVPSEPAGSASDFDQAAPGSHALIARSRQARSRIAARRIAAGRFGPVALALLAFLILPNLPYCAWLGRFTPTRAVVNIDYLLLGIVAPFLAPAVVATGFVLLAILDAFVFVSTLYHFTPRELMLSMSYARYSPIGLRDLPLLDMAMAILTVLAATVLAFQVAVLRRRSGSVLLALLLPILVLADIGNGTNTFAPFTRLPFYSRIQHVAANPVNSGLLAADLGAFLPIVRAPTMTRVESATAATLGPWRPSLADGTNVALILVESWGQIDGRVDLTRAIAAPLLAPGVAARYTVRIGSVDFKGSTTSAELRELCGLRGSYRDLFSLPRFRCLPDRFRAMGYGVTGMHGFNGDMFDRASWWPRIGIEHHLFLDDFRRYGHVGTCGTAFPGLCDADLIAVAADRLTAPRQFVYALTINSHLPLAPVADGATLAWCAQLPVPLDNERCALARQWRIVFATLARQALRPDVKPTRFVIVGDHSPPLLGRASGNFSGRQVPYILLTPRMRP